MNQYCPFGNMESVVQNGMCNYVQKLLREGIEIEPPEGFVSEKNKKQYTQWEIIDEFVRMHNFIRKLDFPNLDFYLEMANTIEYALQEMGCPAPSLYRYEFCGLNQKDINIIYPSCKHNYTWELPN